MHRNPINDRVSIPVIDLRYRCFVLAFTGMNYSNPRNTLRKDRGRRRRDSPVINGGKSRGCGIHFRRTAEARVGRETIQPNTGKVDEDTRVCEAI